jgi:hypothetical protein
MGIVYRNTRKVARLPPSYPRALSAQGARGVGKLQFLPTVLDELGGGPGCQKSIQHSAVSIQPRHGVHTTNTV